MMNQGGRGMPVQRGMMQGAPAGFMGAQQQMPMHGGMQQNMGGVPPVQIASQGGMPMPAPQMGVQPGFPGQMPAPQNVAPMTVDPVDSLVQQLQSLEMDDRTELLGTTLYSRVEPLCGEDFAPKITGMLLDMDQNDIIMLLRDPKSLETKIKEGLSLIKQNPDA